MARASVNHAPGGPQVSELCKCQGITQQEFATCLGFSVVSMSRWTSGRSRPSELSRGIIGLVVRALGVADGPAVAVALRGPVGADPTDRLVTLVALSGSSLKQAAPGRGTEP